MTEEKLTPEQVQERQARENGCMEEMQKVLEKHNCSLTIQTILEHDQTPKQVLKITANSMVESV